MPIAKWHHFTGLSGCVTMRWFKSGSTSEQMATLPTNLTNRLACVAQGNDQYLVKNYFCSTEQDSIINVKTVKRRYGKQPEWVKSNRGCFPSERCGFECAKRSRQDGFALCLRIRSGPRRYRNALAVTRCARCEYTGQGQ